MSARVFGHRVERLADIATRHAVDLKAAEALALGAIVKDPAVDAHELVAFLRWRAIGALKAACDPSFALAAHQLSASRKQIEAAWALIIDDLGWQAS